MSKYTIGIDLGGTTMTAGLVDESYKIVGKVTWATRLPRPAEDLEKAMADLCRTVAKENKVDFADVKYVGIGTPGSVWARPSAAMARPSSPTRQRIRPVSWLPTMLKDAVVTAQVTCAMNSAIVSIIAGPSIDGSSRVTEKWASSALVEGRSSQPHTGRENAA